MKGFKLITILLLSYVSVLSFNLFEVKQMSNYDDYQNLISEDSLILNAKKINDSLREKNKYKVGKIKNRLESIKLDSANKEKIINVQKKDINLLKKKNNELKINNDKLLSELNYLRKDTVNIQQEEKMGFIRRLFEKKNIDE